MTLLVTGGLGFIGSNFIRYWLAKHMGDTIVNIDACTYAAVEDNLKDLECNQNYIFEKADIADFDAMDALVQKYGVEAIVNFAAESHNSNSVLSPTLFYHTNVMGTQTLMEIARQNKSIQRIHHISTCEVYGDMALDCETAFTEQSPLGGNSPYSSSKACSNLVVDAYYKTFGIPVTMSTCCNNYGYYQFPEKVIPVFITNLIQSKPLTLYKESHFLREWLHVDDHCRAIELILEKGEIGQTYNIGSGIEKSVEEIADLVLAYWSRPGAAKNYVASRPSHDRRYLLDSGKIKRELGWEPAIDFEDGLKDVLRWYTENEAWWRPLIEKRLAEESQWK